MAVPPESNNLVLPQKDRGTAGTRDSAFGLPADVVNQSAVRLRVLALLYAFVFVMAAYVPALLLPAERARLLSTFLLWGPGVVAIGVALLVAAVTRRARVPLPAVMNIALMFEVVSSYGIAAAEFLEPMGISVGGHFGLSWVAVWTLLFTIVIPTPPRRALWAALAAVSSVPVVVAFVLTVYPNSNRLTGSQFFVGLVLPYLLVVLMAYVGARVVYALGTEVSRARELGSYHLVERLGQGGMGEVWRAKHRMLARPAAIKLVRPSRTGDARTGASEDARRRFEREAQAIASLRSPHTIELFDFGAADDGTFYYAMELLEGLDADALVRRTGPMPAERAIHVLQQVCHSLAEAHSCGLVHRDIKPANIFLCRYGEDYDFVKVLDFGIVKAAEESADTHSDLTLENAIHGTPAFIAPEQALGGSTIDGRADIYATGCVAYWLLTGELVFTADTPIGLVMHHVQTAPTPPSARTELRIPAALDRLVMSCLAKDPADRPQTAKELSHCLAAIDGANPWTEENARAWWAAHEPALGERAQV
jgi:serine/threonine-protein kinase